MEVVKGLLSKSFKRRKSLSESVYEIQEQVAKFSFGYGGFENGYAWSKGIGTPLPV